MNINDYVSEESRVQLSPLKPRHRAMTAFKFSLFCNKMVTTGKWDVGLANRMKALHEEYKRSQISIGRTVDQRANEFRKRLQVLYDEVNSVKTALNAQRRKGAPANPAFVDALDAYATVLVKCRSRINHVYRSPQYQLQSFVKTINEYNAGMDERMKITNGGAHWFDFVPPHIRAAVEDAFTQSLTTRERGVRMRTPFTRTNHTGRNQPVQPAGDTIPQPQPQGEST